MWLALTWREDSVEIPIVVAATATFDEGHRRARSVFFLTRFAQGRWAAECGSHYRGVGILLRFSLWLQQQHFDEGHPRARSVFFNARSAQGRWAAECGFHCHGVTIR